MRKCLYLVGFLALAAAACGSSGDDDSTIDGSGGGGGLPPLSDSGLGGGSAQFDGGTMPMPDGGIDALRDAACAGWQAAAEPMQSVLMLVVDVSASMNEDAPGGNGSKWDVTRAALEQAIDALPASTAVGLLFYPNQGTHSSTDPVDVTECVNVDAAIPAAELGAAGSDQRQTIADALQQVNVSGSTPTSDAYGVALEALQASTLPGNKYMLLITDGQPTFGPGCQGTGYPADAQQSYITPVIEQITAANGEGIDTFVIGSPGSEQNSGSTAGQDARPWLSQAAREGGTASANCSDTGEPSYCHFDMVDEPDFATGLRNALAAIAGQIVTCDYAMPEPPAGETLDPNLINVVWTPSQGDALLVLRNSAADCQQGWTYDAAGGTIVICPDTCSAVQADPGARLELMFGCASEQVPIQ